MVKTSQFVPSIQVASPAGPPPGTVAGNPSQVSGEVLPGFSVPSGGVAARAEIEKAKTVPAASRIGGKRNDEFFMAAFLLSGSGRPLVPEANGEGGGTFAICPELRFVNYGKA